LSIVASFSTGIPIPICYQSTAWVKNVIDVGNIVGLNDGLDDGNIEGCADELDDGNIDDRSDG